MDLIERDQMNVSRFSGKYRMNGNVEQSWSKLKIKITKAR